MSQDISLNLIDPDPNQPRKHFNETKLQELAQSMGAKGLIVPILVRPAGERYIIIHGERRTRAAQALKWETISAEVRDVSPKEASWLSLIENVQRADLSPIEEARAYRERLAEDITQTVLGERIGKSQSYIAQKLRLLGLPDEIQAAIDGGDLTEGHGRQLLRLKDRNAQRDLSQQALSNKWSVARLSHAIDGILLGLAPDEDLGPSWVELGLISPDLLDYFKLTRVGLVVKKDPPYEKWQALGRALGRAIKSLDWWTGDLANYRDMALDALKGQLDTAATLTEFAETARNAGDLSNATKEHQLRAEREMGRLLADHEQKIERLKPAYIKVGRSIEAVKQILPSEKYEPWLKSVAQMSPALAEKFIALSKKDNPSMDEVFDLALDWLDARGGK